jgi:hypothetical protein
VIDMSPQAVTMRLRRVSQLRRLCLSLFRAKKEELPCSSVHEEPETYNSPASETDSATIGSRQDLVSPNKRD